MPVYKQVNHQFFHKWNPTMAYVLGYFAADGCMIKNKRGAHYIEFTSIDKRLYTFLYKDSGIYYLPRKRVKFETYFNLLGPVA